MGARGKERRSSGSERTTRCPDCQCYVTLLSRQARTLKRGGGGGRGSEEPCWSSCQQMGNNKQDLINAFSLCELKLRFLDLDRFEG